MAIQSNRGRMLWDLCTLLLFINQRKPGPEGVTYGGIGKKA